MIPTSGDKPINTGIVHELAASGIRAASPQNWTRDNRILFSADDGDSKNIWSVRLATATYRIAGKPERITHGSGIHGAPSVAQDRIAFIQVDVERQLWSVPVNANGAAATGVARRLTFDRASYDSPSLSADGRWLAFSSRPAGNWNTFLRTPNRGEDITVWSGSQNSVANALARDGSQLAFGVALPDGKRSIYVYDVLKRVNRKVCDDCRCTPREWVPPTGNRLLVACPGNRLEVLDTNTGARTNFATASAATFSPDGSWVALSVWSPERDGRIFVARIRDGVVAAQRDWVVAGSPSEEALFPGWSPDGKVLYYLIRPREAHQDSVLYAQPFHSMRGQFEGSPVPVQNLQPGIVNWHPTAMRRTLAVSATQIVVASRVESADVWLTTFHPEN